MQIDEVSIPAGTMLAEYEGREAHYADCFEAPVRTPVALPDYIRAFYTQPLFRAERVVLRFAAKAPSTDADVGALAAGTCDDFAVWRLEARSAHEILLADRGGRTMSWLMVAPDVVRFGSVVVPARDRRGRLTLGPVFHSLLSAHKVYSRALLSGAVRRLGVSPALPGR